MAKRILPCLMAAVLIAFLGVAAAGAQTVTSPDIKSIEVIYYARGGIPGPPPKGEEPPVDNSHYELLGFELTGEVAYFVNPAGAPAGAMAEIEEAFEAWDLVTATALFNNTVGTTTVAGVSYDGQNTVSWMGIVPRSIVAMAAIWSVGDTIVEFDIVFNALQKWGIDPDGEGPDKLKRVFDVRNVATHEVGHVVGLADLYEDQYRELTMYGRTSKGEVIRISLEEGDIAGAQILYGTP